MSQSKIRIFKEFLVTQYNFLFFYPFVMTITVLTQALWPPERPRLWVWMLGGLVCFGLYLVRSKVDNFVLVISLHIVALILQVGLALNLTKHQNPMNLVVYLVFCIGFIGYSLKLRFQTDNYEDHSISLMVVVGASAVLIWIQRYVSDYEWTNYYLYLVIIQIAIFFVVSYINEYLNFLAVNVNSTGVMPEKEIFRSGIGLACVYTLGGMLILLATSRLSWLRTIMEFVRRVIVFIVSFFDSLSPKRGPLQEVEQYEFGGEEETGGLAMGGSSWIWEILTVIILIVIAAIALYVLYKLLRHLIQMFNDIANNKRKEAGINDLNEIIDVREKLDISKGKQHRRKPGELFGFLSAQDRIRRIYKKKVSQYKPNRLTGSEKQRKDDFTEERLKYYTAREMEDRMELSFAEIYEKARYSDEECTSRDVKTMEAAFK